jgi:SNF2 family DNA or RNA helicase
VKNERKLFPYQVEGAKWLASRKTCLLADSPRLGKAVQCIAAIDLIDARLVIIVCRGVARANWQNEFETWSKRKWRYVVVFGRSTTIDWGRHIDPLAVIVNYENLDTVLSKVPAGFKFDIAVVDEAHYAKNPGAARTALVFGPQGLPKFTHRHWCTTGTPTPNGLASELWPLLFTYGATDLGYWDFAKKFCVVQDTGFGPRIVGTRVDEPGTMAELHSILAKKVLRREAKDVSIQLPKMSFSTVMVPPGKVDLRLCSTWWKYVVPVDRTAEFNAIIERELGIVEGIMADKTLSPILLETLKAQSKSISTLRRYTALQKLEPALELIAAELEAGAYQKVVIFAHHLDPIKGAQRYLARFGVVTMYGGSNPNRVAMNIKKFQNPKSKTRVFIGQISAAGTSISLSAANHIFFLEESFVPDDNVQAAMRCGGVNQPKPIFVRTFCLENSYDRRLQDIIRQKTSENAKIYQSDKTKIPDELKDLI